MKKLLIILTFLVSTIFVIDNVNAEEVVHVNVDYDSTYVSGIIEELSEEIEIANELANYYKSSQRYAIVLTENRVNFILYESATTTQVRPMFSGGANNKIEGKPDNTSYKYIELINDDTYDLDSLISSLDSKSYSTSNYWYVFNSSRYIYGNSIPKETFDLYQYSSENYSSFSAGIGIIYDTNLDDIEIIETSYFLPISFNNGDILYVGDSFLTYKQVMDTTPTINITKENETSVTILEQEYITDVTLNIEFSSIDNDKYLYMYKYGSDSDWTTLMLTQSNSISKTFSTNDTLYVQILDTNTLEYVTAATFTINSINYDYTPYITIEEITPDSCVLEDYIICQSLQINSHIVDFDRYNFIVIDHTQDITEEFDEQTVYKTYYMNSDIEVRIVDKKTSEIIDIKGFAIRTIDEETDNLGQHITFECNFAKYGTNYLCNYYFYNYNPDLYEYYYGTSTTNFEKLYSQTETTGYPQKYIYKLKEGLGKLKEISYSANTTAYFKIIDKETSEIVYTKTFTINYDKNLEEAGKTSIFDIFKDFKNENSGIKSMLEDIWTKITSSSIYEYILIVIIGTLIIVIIKAANR